MALNILNDNNSLIKIFALGAVVVGLVVAGTFVFSSGTDTNITAVTETASEAQTSTATTTEAPVAPVNNNVDGTTTTVEGVNTPAVNDVAE